MIIFVTAPNLITFYVPLELRRYRREWSLLSHQIFDIRAVTTENWDIPCFAQGNQLDAEAVYPSYLRLCVAAERLQPCSATFVSQKFLPFIVYGCPRLVSHEGKQTPIFQLFNRSRAGSCASFNADFFVFSLGKVVRKGKRGTISVSGLCHAACLPSKKEYVILSSQV